MLEFILATAIIVGKADISPNETAYQVLTDDGQIVEVVDTNSTPSF